MSNTPKENASLNLHNRTPSSLEDFSAMTTQLANELWAVMNHRNLHSGVLLAALIDVHQSVVHRLSEEGQQTAALALRSYSDTLLAHCDLDNDIHMAQAMVSNHQLH